jgi:hypothetical protein
MSHLLWTSEFVSMLALLSLSALYVGCDSEEPEDGVGEEELITRVTVTLAPNVSGAAIEAVADDPDGDGTNLTIETITLQTNTTYTGMIELEDTVNGADITAEVEEEAEEHQFWYTPEGGVADRLAMTITDRDANDLPVGLQFTVTVSAGAGASGTLNVVLSHYDESPKTGTNRSDESDIDIDFPVTILP